MSSWERDSSIEHIGLPSVGKPIERGIKSKRKEDGANKNRIENENMDGNATYSYDACKIWKLFRIVLRKKLCPNSVTICPSLLSTVEQQRVVSLRKESGEEREGETKRSGEEARRAACWQEKLAPKIGERWRRKISSTTNSTGSPFLLLLFISRAPSRPTRGRRRPGHRK